MDNVTPEAQALIWNQDGADITFFHLHQSGQVIATMTVGKDGDSVARFDAGSLHLRFNHKGLLDHHYIICDANNTELASYEAATIGSHGMLQIANGLQVHWKKTNLLFRRYAFELDDGSNLLHFDGHGTMRTEVKIDILQPLANDELLLLASFGMYLIVKENGNATTTTNVH